jgi:hypothetical protein
MLALDTESWHLLSQGRVLPPARHKHSAVIHDDVMWVYGGMTDLHERSDLWRFDFGSYFKHIILTLLITSIKLIT